MAKTKAKAKEAAEETVEEVTTPSAAESQAAPQVNANEVQNPIQMLEIYNQAVQIGQQKGIFAIEDSEVIAKAKRFGTGFTMKEKLKVNFNNSFFKQVEKQVNGQTVYNYEPTDLEPTATDSREVNVYEITEQVLFFANDQVYVAQAGDTVIEFRGTLFFEQPAPSAEETAE